MMSTNTHNNALPFEPLVPNETTIEAMREARTGKLKSFDSVEALMADLDAEDEYLFGNANNARHLEQSFQEADNHQFVQIDL